MLYVDDNVDHADTSADLLSLFGYESRACYDGETALSEAQSFRPTICLIDLNMPGMDGDELAICLKKLPQLRPPHLVAVTAMNSSLEASDRIERAGFPVPSD